MRFVDLPPAGYADASARARFFRELLDRTAAAPGIRAAAIVDAMPLHRVQMANFYIAGRPDPATLLLAAAVILAMAPAAIYIPLWRATRIDCTVALRQE